MFVNRKLIVVPKRATYTSNFELKHKKYLNTLSETKHFCSSVVEVLPCSPCFVTCMGAHFPTVELDIAILFSNLSRMSQFLLHSSRWACQFSPFLQYMSGLEMLACSLDNDLNYVTTMLQLCLSLNH